MDSQALQNVLSPCFAVDKTYCRDPPLTCVLISINQAYVFAAWSQGGLLETPHRWHATIYCRVPARRGLQRTAQAATRHGARDPLVRPQVDQTYIKPLKISKLGNHLDKNFKT